MIIKKEVFSIKRQLLKRKSAPYTVLYLAVVSILILSLVFIHFMPAGQTYVTNNDNPFVTYNASNTILETLDPDTALPEPLETPETTEIPEVADESDVPETLETPDEAGQGQTGGTDESLTSPEISEVDDDNSTIITAFEELSAEVSFQTLSIGLSEDQIELPVLLNAYDQDNSLVEIPVLAWESDKEFLMDQPGAYTYLPTIDLQYNLGADIELPSIQVEVVQPFAAMSLLTNRYTVRSQLELDLALTEILILPLFSTIEILIAADNLVLRCDTVLLTTYTTGQIEAFENKSVTIMGVASDGTTPQQRAMTISCNNSTGTPIFILNGDLSIKNLTGIFVSRLYANGHRLEIGETVSGIFANIYGGNTTTVTGNTELVIKGTVSTTDTVRPVIYGGGDGADVIGSTSITLGGSASFVEAYGGGRNGNVTGDTHVVVDAPVTGKLSVINMLYGGGTSTVTGKGLVGGSTRVDFYSGIVGGITGGGNNQFTSGFTTAAVSGNTTVNIGNGVGQAYIQATYVLGGSRLSTVGGNTYVIINTGAFIHEYSNASQSKPVSGGGTSDIVNGTTNITINGGVVPSRVHGLGIVEMFGARAGTAYSVLNQSAAPYASNITVNGGTIGRIYAYDEYVSGAQLNGNIKITVHGGSIKNLVGHGSYGASATSDNLLTGKTVDIHITGGTLGIVEGRSSAAGTTFVIYDGAGTSSSYQQTARIQYVSNLLIQNNSYVQVGLLYNGTVLSSFSNVYQVAVTAGSHILSSVNGAQVDGDVYLLGNWNAPGNFTMTGNLVMSSGELSVDGLATIVGTIQSTSSTIRINGGCIIGTPPVTRAPVLSTVDVWLSDGDTITLNNVSEEDPNLVYGNVNTQNSDIYILHPTNIQGNLSGTTSDLFLAHVSIIDNYPATPIPLRVAGTASGSWQVRIVNKSAPATEMLPTKGENYIINTTAGSTATFTFVSGLSQASGFVLKAFGDPVLPDGADNTMWQIYKDATTPPVNPPVTPPSTPPTTPSSPTGNNGGANVPSVVSSEPDTPEIPETETPVPPSGDSGGSGSTDGRILPPESASGSSWALIDLVCAAIGAIIALVSLVKMIAPGKKKRRFSGWRVLSMVAGLITFIWPLLTMQLSGQMVLAIWPRTAVYIILALISITSYLIYSQERSSIANLHFVPQKTGKAY